MYRARGSNPSILYKMARQGSIGKLAASCRQSGRLYARGAAKGWFAGKKHTLSGYKAVKKGIWDNVMYVWIAR